MADSDDEEILYDNDLGRNLIGGKRVKNVDDVLNGGKKDKRKLRKTLALCLAFLCLGLCLSILGPTLLSLMEHLHTTLRKISLVFAARSVGYLSGAILGGMLFESFNPLFLLSVVLLLCGIGILAVPLVTSVLVLAVCISSVGISMGVLDTGANVLCLRMWGKKRSCTMLQALHFSFALGAFISPLVAAPFLAETTANSTTLVSPSPLNSVTLALSVTSTVPGAPGENIPDKPDNTEEEDTPDNTEVEDKPDKTLVKDKPDDTEVEDTPDNTKEEDTPDNTEVEDTPDNTKEEDTPDNTKEEVNPDNTEVEDTPDNTKEEDTPDNTKEEDTPDNTKEEDTPDNTEVEDTPDNTKEEDTPDNTKEEVKPDNTEVKDKPDNTEVKDKPDNTEVEDTPDNAKEEETPDNTKEEDTPDNTKEEDTSDNTKEDKPDNNKVEDTPDNTKEEDTPDNNKEEDTPDNTKEEDTPDNTKEDKPENTEVEDKPVKTRDREKRDNTGVEDTPDNTEVEDKPVNAEVKDKPDNTGVEDTHDNTGVEDTPDNTEVEDTPDNTEVEDTPDNTKEGDKTDNNEGGDKDTPSKSEQPALQREVERFLMAYIIIGILVLLTCGVFVYLLCTKPKDEPRYIGSEHSDTTSDKDNCPFRTRILVLLFFFYFLYVGGEVAYGSFVPAFASKSKHHFEQDRASHVAALFWGTFALGRGLAICLASVISPLKMVIADMVGCVSASVALTLFADSNENILWVCSALLGLSMASLFPTGIVWLETYTPVTGNTASFLIVGSALGEMCVPVLIGSLFDEHIVGPMVLMYWMLATSALSSLIFVYVFWLMAENGRDKKSLPAEKSPALELFKSVEEALPMEELFKNGGSHNKQMSKPRVPPILKRKNHKE